MPDSAEEVVAVETNGAGARYGGRWALSGCSLRIPQGSVVAVVGRNGAGKSTLLQMLAGLRRPDAGSVTVLGDSMWPAPAGLLSRVGYVGQHKPLYGGLRVAELLTLGPTNLPNEGGFAKSYFSHPKRPEKVSLFVAL